MLIENAFGQFAFGAGLKPFLVRVMDEVAVADVLAKILIVVEKVATQPFNKFTQRRAQRRFLGGTLAVGKAHRRCRITNMQ